jgi:hypothetical protein
MHQSRASTKAHSAEMVEAYLVREEIGLGDGGNNNSTLLSSLVLVRYQAALMRQTK